MSDPTFIPHLKGTKTVFGLRLLRDGEPIDLTGLTLRAGVEKDDSTAAASFVRFALTGHGTEGTVSGTIPATGVTFTGAATLRVWSSGSPRTFLGPPVPVRVRELSSNWISG